MAKNKLQRLDEGPYMRAWGWTREDGIRVEVVECYQGDYNVFMTLNGDVVAVPVEQYRVCGHGYVGRVEAFRIASTLI